MKGLLAISVIALIHCSYAALVLKGPSQPVLRGVKVTLECLISNPELNTSQVHFEFFSERMQKWYRVSSDEEDGYISRCFYSYYNLYVRREESRLLLDIGYASSLREGSYRCASDADNTTAADVSQPLTFKVHYMEDPVLYRAGYLSLGRYLGSLQDLKVPLGDDVVVDCSARSSETPEYFWQKEGDDWILPSSKLTLKKVNLLDGGKYTCKAQHPTVASLTKSQTISITVLPDDAPWYESSSGRLILMTSAAVAAFLVLVLSVSVFLCRRAKQAKTSKGPIDDRSQKKPIYKASVESLPSTCADKQPLV